MRPLLLTLPALLLVGCNGGGTPLAHSGIEGAGLSVPVYQLEPPNPEDRPLVVNRPYELESPLGAPSEVEHQNSIRLYGPGISSKRQIRV